MTTYSAVVSTGIYCRPGCGARPLARNVRLFDHPAAAEAAGFRACHRCRPYRIAGPVSSSAPDLVCEAVQRIITGALDDGGTEAALAQQVGVSARHLRRLFLQHLGATPDQLARSRRAHFARRLLDDTDLTVLDIAFAAGFGSLRQFNRSMREVFAAPPTDLRDRRRRADRLAADGGLALRLPTLPGYRWDAMCAFLAARRVPGVEAVSDCTYRRTITVAGAPGLLEVSPGDRDWLLLRVHLPYWEGLIHVVECVSQLLGTERDESAGAAALSSDPVLAPLVAEQPGLAVPGAWNPFELEVWTVLSGHPHRDRLLEALVTSLGIPVPGLPGGLTHTFPDAAAVADGNLAALGFPEAEARAITRLAAGSGGNSSYVAFRTGRRDAFPQEDPALQAALTDLGLAGPALAWQPWLALAGAYLIAHGDRLARADHRTDSGLAAGAMT
jgi:AraC family transcriptional regulator, regulatory protein of adaptative response / DNA-3-methyladenine glycosylase II